MSFWTDFAGGFLGSAVFVTPSLALVTGWIHHKYDKQLEEFKHSIARLQFVSSSVYKQREEAIFKFDQSVKDSLGLFLHLVSDEPVTYLELDKVWQKIRDADERMQLSRFRGHLVFRDDLVAICDELFIECSKLKLHAEDAASFHAVRLSYRFPDEPQDFVREAPTTDEYLRCRKEIRSGCKSIADNLFPKWKSEVRDALLNPEAEI